MVCAARPRHRCPSTSPARGPIGPARSFERRIPMSSKKRSGGRVTPKGTQPPASPTRPRPLVPVPAPPGRCPVASTRRTAAPRSPRPAPAGPALAAATAERAPPRRAGSMAGWCCSRTSSPPRPRWRRPGRGPRRSRRSASCSVRLEPDEVAPTVGFLTGVPRQGRIGVGWRTAFKVEVAPADEPSIEVLELDRDADRAGRHVRGRVGGRPPARCSATCSPGPRRRRRTSCATCSPAGCARARWPA